MWEKLIAEWKEYLKFFTKYPKATHEEAAEKYGEMDIEDWESVESTHAEMQEIYDESETLKASTEITMALGWCRTVPRMKLLGAKQKAPLPPYVEGFYPPPGYTGEPLRDAHEILRQHDGAWYSERTGVHAEVMIIRAWLLDLGAPTIEGLKSLKDNAVIVASQPACWCCARLMKTYGIAYPKDAGKKPKTGWKHPLSMRTVPNSEIPSNRKDVDTGFLEKARLYKGLF